MEAVLTHTRRVWEKRRIEPLGALCGGWKEWGVRVEGLMARGVGAPNQEQKWTKDPCWKEATRQSGRLNDERGRACLFIHEARRIVGCRSFANSGVRATLGTEEVTADTDVIIIRWSGERGQGRRIRGTTDRWGWGWNRRRSWLGRCQSRRLNWWWGWCWWETDMATCTCSDF